VPGKKLKNPFAYKTKQNFIYDVISDVQVTRNKSLRLLIHQRQMEMRICFYVPTALPSRKYSIINLSELGTGNGAGLKIAAKR